MAEFQGLTSLRRLQPFSHPSYLKIYSNADIFNVGGFDRAITAKARNRHCIGGLMQSFAVCVGYISHR
jgi:hypothetical protein